jgi:hypothetical protein
MSWWGSGVKVEGHRVADPALSELVFQFVFWQSLAPATPNEFYLALKRLLIANWLWHARKENNQVWTPWNVRKLSNPMVQKPDSFIPDKSITHSQNSWSSRKASTWAVGSNAGWRFRRKLDQELHKRHFNHCTRFARFLPNVIAEIQRAWNMKSVISYHGPLWAVDLVNYAVSCDWRFQLPQYLAKARVTSASKS